MKHWYPQKPPHTEADPIDDIEIFRLEENLKTLYDWIIGDGYEISLVKAQKINPNVIDVEVTIFCIRCLQSLPQNKICLCDRCEELKRQAQSRLDFKIRGFTEWRSSLTNRQIKSILIRQFNCLESDISDHIVELKRRSILLKRELKKQKKDGKQTKLQLENRQ